MKKKWITAAAAFAAVLCMTMTGYAENGWTRVPNDSPWKGTYYRSDGQKFTIEDADEEYLYYTFTNVGGIEGEDVLKFTNAEKTKAVSMETKDTPVTYALYGDTIYVDSSSSQWKLFQGKYKKQDGASCWRKEADGSYVYLESTGKVLKDSAAPDGWYVGSDGKWDQSMGMVPFAPGTYRSIYVHPEWKTAAEQWSFSMFTNLSEEEWRLNGPSDRRLVGTADYEAYDNTLNPYYSKTGLYVYNTMQDGYVVEDAGGEIFAWLYPVSYEQGVMVQMYGSEEHHLMRMTENYADYGG